MYPIYSMYTDPLLHIRTGLQNPTSFIGTILKVRILDMDCRKWPSSDINIVLNKIRSD